MTEHHTAPSPAGYLGVVSYVIGDGSRLDGIWETANVSGTEIAERLGEPTSQATGRIEGTYSVIIRDQSQHDIFAGELVVVDDADRRGEGAVTMAWDGVVPDSGSRAHYEGLGLLRENVLAATWKGVPAPGVRSENMMITLISRWKLKNGAPPELCTALDALAAHVADAEPDTLVYLVHVAAQSPLGAISQPLDPSAQPITDSEQNEVVFFEVYRDADAFSRHLLGPTFTSFRDRYLAYFYTDPEKPGWPLAPTQFLSRQSGLIRDELQPEN